MTCTIKSEEINRVKALGFLNNRGTDLFNGRIITVNGKISAEQTAIIAKAAKKFGNGDVAFTARLTVEVRGIHFDNIEPFREFISRAGLETGGTGSLVRPVVSCKGTTCQYGLYDTFDLSEKIHVRFYKGYHAIKLPHKFKIATGGCPNSCVKPSLNDLGIIGQLVPNINEDKCNKCRICQVEIVCPMKAVKLENNIIKLNKDICINCGRCIKKCPFDVIKKATLGFKVYIGGRWGKETSLGQALNKIFISEEEVLNVVEKAILLFREQGYSGERFANTIKRIGFEEVEKQLLSDDILDRKQEILDAKLLIDKTTF